MRSQLSILLVVALFTSAAMAQDTQPRGTNDPHEQADGSWIGIAGNVESTSPGAFVLDYGDGTIKVELEPSSTQNHDFIQNEQVRVYGVVDAGLFTAKTIKAHAVYVESMKSYVCTTEGSEAICTSFAPAILSGVVVYGRVTEVTPGSVKVDQGDQVIEIDTSALNATESGIVQDPAVKVGDRVTVLCHMNEGLFSRKLKADTMDIVL